jgi:chorismate mutase / prephenate dehydratase
VARTPTLDSLRVQIDRVDTELLRLLNQRAALVVQVGHTKSRNGHTHKYVPEREKRIFQRLAQMNEGPLRPQHVRTIYREIISSCRALEQPLRVAYLGPAGTYCQQAAGEQFGSGPNLLPFGSVDAVFDEVERGRAEYGVVPVENSTEGVVAQTLDRFIASPLTIKAEVLLRIDHCLLAQHAEPRRIRRIVSHPQSLAQCRGWLAQHLPGIPVSEVASNAIAAEQAVAHAGTAAIASRRAAERLRLKIVAASIQDLPNNVTRFLVVSNDLNGKPTGDDKTSILFAVPHESGALFKVLQVFAQQRINLSTIESRPLKGRAWEYVFFIDLSGHSNEPRMRRALAALTERALFVKVLGSYPAWRWPEGEAKP